MYAIVATGGKQYKVAEGDVIEVEKLNAEVGDSVALNVVLYVVGSTVVTDQESLTAAKVFADVVEHFKGEKQLIFKLKKRKGYKRLRGHRQDLTRLEIMEISLTGKKTKKSKDSLEGASKKEEAGRTKVVAAKASESLSDRATASRQPATKTVPAAPKATSSKTSVAPKTTSSKAPVVSKAPTAAKAPTATKAPATSKKPAGSKPLASANDKNAKEKAVPNTKPEYTPSHARKSDGEKTAKPPTKGNDTGKPEARKAPAKKPTEA